MFCVLPSQVHRLWQLVISYPDYLLQFSLLLCHPIYWDCNVRRGAGQPILLIPGFLVGDWTLRVMARWLLRIGYRPYLSGIDWNVRAPERTGELLAYRLQYIFEETGCPVILVGHSLGGLLARFLTSALPVPIARERVRHVITIGSPIQHVPHTVHPALHLAWFALDGLRKAVRKAPADLLTFTEKVSAPLPTGIGSTSIFSTKDEIVDWHACVDPQGDNYQVSGRHVGLVVNRHVYHVLADVLSVL